MDSRNVIAIDIGGSSIKSGLFRFNEGGPGDIQHPGTLALDSRTFEAIHATVHQSIQRLAPFCETGDVGVGISTSGSVDKNEVVVSAGHFSGYENVNWGQIVSESYPYISHVAVANDGRASALGEFLSFDSSGSHSHVHFVVGTGVGGGIIHNDDLLIGESGQAGYVGHIKISTEPTIICSCKKQGCVETLASAPAIVDHFRRECSLIEGVPVSDFNKIVDLAKNGDQAAIKAFAKAGYALGVGIGNVLNVLNSSTVTVGGGVAVAATQLEDIIGKRFYLDSIMDGFEFASHRRVFGSAKVAYAKLGNDGGMFGAAILTERKMRD